MAFPGTEQRGSALDDEDTFRPSHRTIPDSALNYDTRIRENVDSTGNLKRDEPDCSPNPLDLLAINALYQTTEP